MLMGVLREPARCYIILLLWQPRSRQHTRARHSTEAISEPWGGKRGWSRGGKRGRRSGQMGEDWTGSLTAREFNRKPAQARVTFLQFRG